MDKDHLIELAKGIVIAQSNVFIKELLRDNGIKIGSTKADFQQNMIQAINAGELTREHFDRWLLEIEGWGNQHIYLFDVDERSIRSDLWNDESNVRERAHSVGLKDKWNVAPSESFPEDRELAGIYYDANSFRAVWYEGRDSWIKESDKDYRAEEDGDLYEYRAFRQRLNRTVTRFEWPRGSQIASVFIQIPWNKKNHNELMNVVLDAISSFIPKNHLTLLNIGHAIRNLDQAALNQPALASNISPQMARLETNGGYINFGCNIPGQAYGSVEAVRHVREAILHPEDFTGDLGVFYLRDSKDQSLSRQEIKVEMHGKQNRIKIAHQCSREDAWVILNIVAGQVS